jgi:hypothetical protein
LGHARRLGRPNYTPVIIQVNQQHQLAGFQPYTHVTSLRYTQRRMDRTHYFISRTHMVALPSGESEGGIVTTRRNRYVAAAIRRALLPLALGTVAAMPVVAQETSDRNSQQLQEDVVTGIPDQRGIQPGFGQ